MTVELHANDVMTTVTAGGTTAPAGGTSQSFTVSSSTNWPAAATGVSQFRIIDQADTHTPPEIMVVTNVSGTTWTVTRGAEGPTVPWAHASNWTAIPVLTAGALAAVLAVGDGSPFNVVTPTAKGQAYLDATNGGLYVATGATSADWTIIGGRSPDNTPPGGTAISGVGYSTGEDTIAILASAGIWISDIAAWSSGGTGNGVFWQASSDGSQIFEIFLGSSGQYNWIFDSSGVLFLPNGIGTEAITTGALPTISFTSGVGKQVSTVRDTTVVVPTSTAGTVQVELSPDGVTYTSVYTKTALALDEVTVPVPWNWYVRLTTVTSTLGTGHYY